MPKNASAVGALSITGGRGMPIRYIDRCAATVKNNLAFFQSVVMHLRRP